MQLKTGERALLAYFPTSNDAQKAAAELKKAGIEEVQVDRISRFGVNNDAEINNPIAGRAETITGLALYSTGTDSLINDDTRVLKAADPSVSGYGNHDYGVAGGAPFMVSAVTSDDLFNSAEAIIKKCGGKM
ncbi:hypothetical protein [Desulfotruncus alcoholivorax]|uniref:hypothetical protein n=1 Tax=Desulfotruncus alcoholivorax TaxID=265477 RepID=UPI0004289325|nr:hypothetical protein [Desulfotruncus alcoholivorax]